MYSENAILSNALSLPLNPITYPLQEYAITGINVKIVKIYFFIMFGRPGGTRTHDHQDSHEDQTSEGGEGASSIPNEDGSMSSEGEDEDWNDVDIVPTELHEVNNMFCYAALADKKAGTMYTDQTGALPAISLDGHQYFLWPTTTIVTISTRFQSRI